MNEPPRVDDVPGTSRILLLVGSTRDRALLADQLEAHYEVHTPEPDDAWGEFDLCLVDVGTYPEVADRLAARRAAEAPRYLPVCLLAPTGRDATGVLASGVVDDLLVLPTARQVVDARVATLLHVRQLSHDLDDERERFRSLAATASDAILVVDTDATVVYANAAVETVFGYPPETIEGESLTTVMPPERRARFRTVFQRYVESGERTLDWSGVEFHARHADGHEVPVEVSFAEFEQDGERHITGIVRDVTDRKRREAELERTLDLFERTQQIADVGGWEYDPGEGFVRWTEQACRIHGTTGVRELSLDDVVEQYHPDERPALREALRRAVEDGEPIDARYRLDTGGAPDRWVHVRGEPRQVDGQTKRVRGAVQDVTQQRALAASLREETLLLERIFDSSPVAITVLDRAGNIVRANETAESILGLEQSEITSRSYDAPEWEIFDEEGGSIPSEALPFARALATGEPVVDYQHGIRTAGEVRWLSVNVAPLPDDQPLAAVATVQDITERRRRQQELREEKALVENLFDVVPDTFFVIDTDVQLDRWNRRMTEITGYTDDELADISPLECVVPEDRERVADAITRVLVEEETVTTTFDVLQKDGGTVPFEVIGTPLTDETGTVTGLVGTGRDRSEYEQRRRELERFELIVQTASDPIYTLDADGRFTLVNDAVTDLTDREREELLGAHVADVLGEAHATDLLQCLAECRAAGDTRGTITTTIDGGSESREYQTQIAVEPSDDGYRGCVCVSRDITDLVEHQRRLSVLDRVLRHNLRNKLNIVHAHASTILTDETADSGTGAQKILDATESLLNLSENARKFQSSIAPGSGTIERRDVVEDLVDVVDAIQLSHPEARIDLSVPDSAVAVVHEAFDIALEEVLLNAIVHADQPEPTVEVTVSRIPDEDAVELRIADEGPGIPERVRQVVLRGDETPLEHLNGLGLWLVRWVVRNSAGDLDIEPNDPRGTVVTLRLYTEAEFLSDGGADEDPDGAGNW